MVSNDYSIPVDVATGDELGSLSASIDELRRSFLAQRRSLQDLNERLDAKVEARTRELEQVLEHLRQTQEALLRAEKLASIGRLAGGIAHEINNPAAIILTRTGLLLETAREEGLSEDMVESLQVIDRQVSRISRITHDLLVFSRRAPMRSAPVNLSETLAWSWTLYSQKARELKIQLAGDIPPRVMVRGDAAGLEQVIDNLVKNALDAMEETGGELTRRVVMEGGLVRLIVEDTGPGIDPAILPRIFDPFFTTKKVGKGTGLGLAIAYGILEELGGTVEAANRPEGGAVFTVTLKAAPDVTLGPPSEVDEAVIG
jgi:C4-dicarboxylate-specific signal transduction histidine kinase